MPLVPKPDTELVEDVQAAFWKDIGDRFPTLFWIIAIGLPFTLFGLSGGGAWFVILGVAPAAIWLAYRYQLQKELFMRRFGALYDFSYRHKELPGGRYYCRLFQQGRSRKMTNILHGTYDGHPIELFHYEFTIGSGKHKKTHFYTACIVEFDGVVPDIVIEEKRFLQSDRLADQQHKRLRLEGNFSDHFRLFVAEDLEIEALEILTPEIMEQLIERGRTYSFEFRGHRLYLIENTHLTSRKELSALIEFSGSLVDRLGPRLARLHDDVEAMKMKHTQASS